MRILNATSSLRALARGALLLLAAVLPFELTRPVGRVGPLALSSVELFLYAALALGGASIAADALVRARGEVSWRRLAERYLGVAAWGLVLILSAACAPVHRAVAAKFALRSLGGVALYVAAASLLRAPGAALRTAAALALGALAAALLMWAELHLPGAGGALTPFHPATFDVLGLARASGPFQYPNIATMYLEAALPVLLAVGAAAGARRELAGRRPGPGLRTMTIAAALALAGAVSLTASRAGLITVVVTLAGLALHARVKRTSWKWEPVATLAGLALLAGGGAAAGSVSALRMKFWQDGRWYRSSISAVEGAEGGLPVTLAPSEKAIVALDVRNAGVRPWPASGEQVVNLSYHWEDRDTGRTAIFDGVRTKLPHDVAPGTGVRLNAVLRAPREPGRYLLRFDMVHEGITWFSEQGDTGLDAPVDVRAPGTGDADLVLARASAPGPKRARPRAPAADSTPATLVARPALWRAALLAFRRHPLLGLGPDNFRLAYGGLLGMDHPDERLHANNLYLETLATLGLLGAAALALLIASLGRAARRALRRHGSTSPEGLLAAGLAAGLAAYAVHGLFDYFMEFTPTYALAWLLAGTLVALGDATTPNDRVGGAGPSQGPE